MASRENGRGRSGAAGGEEADAAGSTMRAVLRSDGRTQLARVPAPRLERRDDVRVRVAVAGVCRTDVYVATGQLRSPRPAERVILGHEAAGVVEEIGEDARHLAVGDRVALVPWVACEACAGCRRGDGCLETVPLGVVRDGAFAEWIVLPAASLVRLPPSLPLRLGAYVEPVAAALAAVDVVAALPAGTPLLLGGRGRITELTRRLLVALAPHVSLATFADVAPPHDAAEEAARRPPRGHFDAAIETVANAYTLAALVDALRPGGTLVLKSRPSLPVPLDVAACVRRGVTLRAVGWGSFARAAGLLAEGRVLVEDLLDPPAPLDDFARLLADDAAAELRKPLFAVDPLLAAR